jgi:hypothetical protein
MKFEPLHASIERDQAKTSLYALSQVISIFSHGKASNFGEGLEYIKIWSLTKGIDLELSTLGDRIEEWNFHLESLELENHTEKVKERVSTEKDPREVPHMPLRPPVIRGKVLEGWVIGHRCLERERDWGRCNDSWV